MISMQSLWYNVDTIINVKLELLSTCQLAIKNEVRIKFNIHCFVDL